MNIHNIIDITVDFTKFILYTLALIPPMPWYDKIPQHDYGYARQPGIGYGLYLDDYMSMIYYNTVTM